VSALARIGSTHVASCEPATSLAETETRSPREPPTNGRFGERDPVLVRPVLCRGRVRCGMGGYHDLSASMSSALDQQAVSRGHHVPRGAPWRTPSSSRSGTLATLNAMDASPRVSAIGHGATNPRRVRCASKYATILNELERATCPDQRKRGRRRRAWRTASGAPLRRDLRRPAGRRRSSMATPTASASSGTTRHYPSSQAERDTLPGNVLAWIGRDGVAVSGYDNPSASSLAEAADS
jgi:hypothetical protein